MKRIAIQLIETFLHAFNTCYIFLKFSLDFSLSGIILAEILVFYTRTGHIIALLNWMDDISKSLT